MTKRTLQDFIVAGFGFVTSVLVALILALMESHWGFAFYSFTVWFVIPMGAILAGCGGASGYYFGGRLFHHRPTRLMLFNMISVAISTYFLINYLNYSWMQIDGQRVADVLPFSQYLDVILNHQSMEFRLRTVKLGETGDMGGFGLIYAALQVQGFAVGGFWVYRELRSLPFCAACSKYLKKQSTTIRYADDPREGYIAVGEELGYGDTAAAKDALLGFGSPKPKSQKFSINLTLRKCVACPQEHAECWVGCWNGKNWQPVPGMATAWRTTPPTTGYGRTTAEIRYARLSPEL
jgi:hypothetical protein